MKAFAVILFAVALSSNVEGSCYNDVIQACMSTTKKCKFLNEFSVNNISFCLIVIFNTKINLLLLHASSVAILVRSFQEYLYFNGNNELKPYEFT